MERDSCVVLVPVHSVLEPETESGLRELASRGYPIRFLKGASDIVLARITMATQAMRDGYAETFWIDGDVTFNPDDVDRIRQHGKPFVAGLYPRKGRAEFAAKFKDDTLGATFGTGGGLMAMQYVGFGFTHVRREVYEAMSLTSTTGGYDGQVVTPYFLPMCGRLGYLAEDYAFCVRAREAGFEILADTRVKLGHVGRHTWTWDDFTPRPVLETLDVGVGPPKDATMTIYERFGRLQEAFDAENQTLLNAISTLAAVKSGSIKPEQLEVTETSWKVLPLQLEEAVNAPENRIKDLMPSGNGTLMETK